MRSADFFEASNCPDITFAVDKITAPGQEISVHGSKTATRILSDDQLADYQPWFDNHKRLRELITQLEELSLAVTDNDPRWNR